jgi:hypothetical protein
MFDGLFFKIVSAFFFAEKPSRRIVPSAGMLAPFSG